MKIIAAFILFFVVSCGGVFETKSENEKFIQGKWHLAGTLGDESENRAWFLEWEFNNGEFTQSGYPPIQQKGKYKVLEDTDNVIKLKLYKQKGTFGNDDSELTIVIDKDQGTLKIDNKKGFKKTKENKKS